MYVQNKMFNNNDTTSLKANQYFLNPEFLYYKHIIEFT